MKKFVKQLFKDYLIGYGLTTLICLINVPVLINREFLTYIAILLFCMSIGSTFAFQLQFRHINIWLRRGILWVYMSILSNIGTYIYIIHILKLSRNMIPTMLKLPLLLLVILSVIYFIADKIEARKIKKMNQSLKKYNQNNTGL